MKWPGREAGGEKGGLCPGKWEETEEDKGGQRRNRRHDHNPEVAHTLHVFPTSIPSAARRVGEDVRFTSGGHGYEWRLS